MGSNGATQILDRQPSERLQEAVRLCASGFRKLQDSIQDALTVGREEGYKDFEIGLMIKQEMLANNYSIRSVQRYLPAAAKRSGGYDIDVDDGGNGSKRNDNLSFQKQIQNQTQVSNYDSENLSKYSKQFLIEIIRYLESNQNQKQKQTIKNVTHEVKKQASLNVVSNNNSNRTHARNKPLPDDKIQLIKDLRAKGMSSRQIFSKTGIARTTIAKYWN